MADFIRFENVSYTYDETEEDEQQSQKQPVVPQRIHYAVEHADFTIQKGEFVAIVGRNGSGKSCRTDGASNPSGSASGFPQRR